MNGTAFRFTKLPAIPKKGCFSCAKAMVITMENMNKALSLIINCLQRSSLEKVIFSKAKDALILRAEGIPVLIKNQTFFQWTWYQKDGKAIHKNIPTENWESFLSEQAFLFMQINIIDANGNAEVKISKKGSVHIIDKINVSNNKTFIPLPHNKEKNYILNRSKKYDFLYLLGIQDKNGRVHDKKQAKFRQINKFLEIISDSLELFPATEPLCIWDLCCGKSYLTFAVYYYFRFILKREIVMYGIDLKRDVIESCRQIANQLEYKDLHFEYGDINTVCIEKTPDIVISLHACDTATDTVLANAVLHSARLILSSPCCHHELSEQLSCPALSFITDYPKLKQKLSETVTDALRCKLLQACGYHVSAIEFIDPDETPKNLLIKAERYTIKASDREELWHEYEELLRYFNVSPTMYQILKQRKN